MTADHLSYRRATGVCLTGLALQIALGLALLIYGVLGDDSAALTGGMGILLGSPIWVALALVFHQHRLERLEALEREAYQASGAAQASVFEESGGDLEQQQQRLAWMHRWFLPTVSLVVAAGFVGVGVVRYLLTRWQFNDEANFAPPSEHGWAISLGVGVAVIGFVFARFVAGMAKQRAWLLLHAGSAAAVGSALIGAGIAASHFIMVAARSEFMLRVLAPVLAGLLVALGAEMVLNFVLNLYRPRKAGEYQRPGFDSRVLAFVAAPDKLAESISEAINYQFGFNVSSTWFYQLLARSVVSLVVLAVGVLWLMSIFTVVAPHERGLLSRNGNLVREVGPGLVIDLPWPLSRVERFPADAVNVIHVGTPAPIGEGPILWTNEHAVEESYMLVQPSGGGAEGGSSDLNLLAIEIPIHYVVSDLKKYKLLAVDGTRGRIDQYRSELLTAMASSAVIEYVATLSVDEILGTRRREMSDRIRSLVQAEFDRAEAGVRVLFAGVAGTHPQKEVAPAFEDVVRTDLRRLAEVEKAEADALRSLAAVVGDVDRARSIVAELDVLERMKSAVPRAPEAEQIRQEQKINDMIATAGGDAAVLIAEAKADRWRKHMTARARAASSEGLIASYRAAPLAFRTKRWLDALREAADGARVYMVPPGVRVRFNGEELVPSVAGFEPAPETNN
ncbi:MAG: SPFH domain-containing protein [Planctomycetota bacterium]|nr:SPFH domain-containing protein [Planctomycetota bacterium]